jgi:hypothetical protein
MRKILDSPFPPMSYSDRLDASGGQLPISMYSVSTELPNDVVWIVSKKNDVVLKERNEGMRM